MSELKDRLVVGVSQRIDHIESYGEVRDALDEELLRWLAFAGCLPVPVPNILADVQHPGIEPGRSRSTSGVSTEGAVETGLKRGKSDPQKTESRKDKKASESGAAESKLNKTGSKPALEIWLKQLGVGAVVLSGGNNIGDYPQRDRTEAFLLSWAGEHNLPVLGICRGMQMMAVQAESSLHRVEGHVRTRHVLNPDGWPGEVNSYHDFGFSDPPDGYDVLARAEDGIIEAIRHKERPWEGWMWHPEREEEFAESDLVRLKELFGF